MALSGGGRESGWFRLAKGKVPTGAGRIHGQQLRSQRLSASHFGLVEVNNP